MPGPRRVLPAARPVHDGSSMAAHLSLTQVPPAGLRAGRGLPARRSPPLLAGSEAWHLPRVGGVRNGSGAGAEPLLGWVTGPPRRRWGVVPCSPESPLAARLCVPAAAAPQPCPAALTAAGAVRWRLRRGGVRGVSVGER